MTPLQFAVAIAVAKAVVAAAAMLPPAFKAAAYACPAASALPEANALTKSCMAEVDQVEVFPLVMTMTHHLSLLDASTLILLLVWQGLKIWALQAFG